MTMYSDLVLDPTDDPVRWNNACCASGQPVTPFHSYAFLSLAARMTGTVFYPLIARSAGAGADVGVAPWLSRARGPVNVVNRMPFPYVGPLVPRELVGSCLRALRRQALFTRTINAEFQFSPGADVDQATLLDSGFQLRSDSTYVIDTARDADQLWAALDSSCRTKIRKVQRDGVVIRQSDDAGDILDKVMRGIFASKGLGFGYVGQFPPSVADLNCHGLEARWTVATLGEVQLGSLVTLLFNGSAAGWVGGVLPEHRATHAGVPLYWDAICWAQQRGARTLDLVGSPDRGIDRFKSQFGAVRLDYPVVQRVLPGLRHLRALDEYRNRSAVPSTLPA